MSAATSWPPPAKARVGRPRLPRTFAEDLATACERLAHEKQATLRFEQRPLYRYRDDPVAFMREVLGFEPWHRQIEIANAVRDSERVAVRSGQKTGKTRIAMGLALWFYATRDEARVLVTCATGRQVDSILWRELTILRARAKYPIDGDMHQLARSGLKDHLRFAEIFGFASTDAEATQGTSGKEMLFIADEASGIPDAVAEAMFGNMAGGGVRFLAISNPTRSSGWFFDAFHGKRDFWTTIHMSSEEAAAVNFPGAGLAKPNWIAERRAEWGERSAPYLVRVKGEFAVNDNARVFPLELLAASESRWPDAPSEGELVVGCDPAGPGLAGDETAIAVRRGRKILAIYAMRGLPEDAIVAQLLGIVAANRREVETPRINVEREGPIGSALYGTLKSLAEAQKIDVLGIRPSDRAMRAPQTYDRLRDELFANLLDWMRTGGGAIPSDEKLVRELNELEWKTIQVNGRLKITDKDTIRKSLGRSTDRADAVAIACWDRAAWREVRAEDRPRIDPFAGPVALGLDPYAGMKAWRR